MKFVDACVHRSDPELMRRGDPDGLLSQQDRHREEQIALSEIGFDCTHVQAGLDFLPLYLFSLEQEL